MCMLMCVINVSGFNAISHGVVTLGGHNCVRHLQGT